MRSGKRLLVGIVIVAVIFTTLLLSSHIHTADYQFIPAIFRSASKSAVQSVVSEADTSTLTPRLKKNVSRLLYTSQLGFVPGKGIGCSNNGTQGYLLAIELCQQSTGSFLAFSQLAKVASLFNLSMVEPYMIGTRINGVPRFKDEPYITNIRINKVHGFESKQPPMPLSRFYDMVSLQNTLKSCGYTSDFDNFETILTKASRSVIYVCFIQEKSQFTFGKRKIIEIDRNKLLDYDKYNFERLRNWVSNSSNDTVPPFQLIRVFVVDVQPSHPLYLSDIKEALSGIIREEVSKNGSATLVFSKWRGLHTESTKYFYYIPDFPSCNVYSVNHSKVILKATEQFSKSLSQIRPVIGVHIRGERLMLTSEGSSYHLDCLQELKNVLQRLVISTKAAHDSVHIFHDLGPYGSDTCERLQHCRQGKPTFVSKIKELGYPVVYYDPAKFDIDPVGVNNAFVSFVEREYLTSQVDVLVTVGRGAYQQSIVERFFDKNPNRTLKRVCSTRGQTY